MTAPAKAQLANVPLELLTLPAFPSVSAKALHLLASSDTRLLELYEVISADPSFSSEILRIANSPLYPMHSTVRNLTQASMLLGFERLKGVVVALGVRSYLFDGLQVPVFRACWRHSLACALIAQEATAQQRRSEDAYTAGILHDVGRLALAAIRSQQYAKLLQNAGDASGDMLQQEREVFGIDHCEAGRQLVSAWHLPQELAAITSQHHGNVKERKEFDLLSIVHYSCRIADILGFHAARAASFPTYEEILQEIPLSARGMFTFDPSVMVRTITAHIDALDVT
jgi:putative nucleotidyltransferase with HDIG domain